MVSVPSFLRCDPASSARLRFLVHRATLMSVRRIAATCACALLLLRSASAAMEGDWPYWRGPNADGMAWARTENCTWHQRMKT